MRQIDAVLAVLQKDKASEADIKRAIRLMRGWLEDMDVLRASLYEAIWLQENDTFREQGVMLPRILIPLTVLPPYYKQNIIT